MRRIAPLLMFVPSLAAAAFAVVTMSVEYVLARFDRLMREVAICAIDHVPRIAMHAKPARLIAMAATALNGRQVGGVRVHGFLGRPAVQMLAG